MFLVKKGDRMNFPTLEQVRKLRSHTKKEEILHNYPLTEEEISKIRSYNPNSENYKPIEDIDTKQSFQKILNHFDSIFGSFYRPDKDNFLFRGRLEYIGKITDPNTGEDQITMILSDPKTLYSKRDTPPLKIRVPDNPNLYSGVYAQIKVKQGVIGKEETIFVEQKDIDYFDFTPAMPHVFMDYSKFTSLFNLDYGFDMPIISQRLRRNLELNNIDLMLINKVAGENFKSDVKGGVSGNIIKTTHDQGTYELEVLDNFLDKVTINNNTSTVFNTNTVDGGDLVNFFNKVDNKLRKLSTTQYKNYYGGNVGFSIQKISIKDENELLDRLKRTCVDYINPIKNIKTKHKSVVDRILKRNPSYYYGSKILLLETQLLPIKTNISDIGIHNPKVLRMASMLKKFTKYIYELGTDEILKGVSISKNDINLAKSFLENNKKEMEDFIIKSY